MKYKLLRFSLLSIFAMLFGVVHADYYEKVTSTNSLTDGDYLIVYEDGGVAFNGSLEDLDVVSNTVDVSINDGQIASSTEVDNAVFTIDVANGTVRSASGRYIGVTSNSNGLKASDEAATYSHTFSIDGDGNAVIAAVFDGSTMTLKFNSASNQLRFRYYKSGQKDVQLYKKTAGAGDTRVNTAIELGDHATNGLVGEQIALPTVTVKTVNGVEVDDAAVVWTSSAPEVATIDGAMVHLLKAGSTTIKATFDGDNSYMGSHASFTLTVTAPPYTSLAALQADVTGTSTPVEIVFNNVFVTAVKGSNAYLADADDYGVLVYQSGHGLEAGQVLNGTALANLVLYRGQTELTNFSAENLNITTMAITPKVKTIDALTAANQSTLVTLKNVTFTDGKLTDGSNEITFYDNFGTEVALEEGKSYDVTGIVILYNTTLEIAPRTADDVVAADAGQPGEEPGLEDGIIYSWDAGNEVGGTAEASDGASVGYSATADFPSTIRLNGKSDFSSDVVTITLDQPLKSGDEIAITGFRNKNAADKQSGALLKFDKGGTATTATSGLEFVNIDQSDDSAADQNRGTEPNTVTLTVPAEADGSSVITMTRAKTQTNLFITKLVITGERAGGEPGEEPGEEPVVVIDHDIAATWDFTNPDVVAAVTALAYSTEPGTIENNGLQLTVEANGLNIRNNGNSIQTGNGVVFKVPVQSNKDVVTVVGYSAPYFAYSVGGIDATEATTVYKAKKADVDQGYVEVVNKGQYLISMSVLQVSPLQEKELYSTDFSEWDAAGAKTSESVVTKTTKYSKETLDFKIYNTAVMSVTDTKFAGYTELPHMALQAAKAADPYVMTSPLASVTKVRFVHGATGNNRGWKFEAKGDGDDDWVVISDAPANPASWCEVVAEVNRTNVQLRWTNLTNNQNAYMFELDIFGKVNMGNTPTLGTFVANGQQYVAGDIFEEQPDGTMTATIELSKSVEMVSASNPLTDIVADNGEIGEVTYAGDATACTVTIPVILGEASLNYVANFVQKADFTLTYYNTDGTVMGTQLVEKDAAIGNFDIDFATAAADEGQKVRGWFVAADGGRKFTTADIISANTALYAVQTPIETASPSERYSFSLNDQYFYAEDHEAFEPVGTGKFHDGTHGWSFANGDKVNLLVGGPANIVLYLCNYSSETPIILTNAAGSEVARIENAKVTPDGAIGTLKYEGEAGVVSLNFNGTCYLHKVIIANQAQPLYTYDAATKTYSVVAGAVAGFLGALDEANGSGNVTIYLPNGLYNLGNECLTTIAGEYITIKGESQTGTVIQNLPKVEGIGVTATLLNTSNYLLLENLTLKNAYPYYDPATGKAAASAGRAVCLQDKGNYTVCRNVTMLSYQDTYYSNNNNGYFYFVDCDIHGLVDFVCGGGDVFYENTTFTLESREVAPGVGDVTIAAPNGAKLFGYVMDGCKVNCLSATFNWGRSWGAPSKLAWLNTTLMQPEKIVSSRFTAAGMNCAADGFFEYNTMDEAGNLISPASNVINFTHATGNKQYETILTAEQAADYSKEKVFEDAPKDFKIRVGLNGGTSIENVVNVVPQDNSVYTLQGVRVQNARKGLYIINGKKVVK